MKKKNIINFEGIEFHILKDSPKYAINKYGDIYSIITKRILKFEISNCGYKRIGLTINGKKIKYSVHRLVALQFIPNLKNKSQVNHIDGNKLNNNLENLEWVSCSENASHAFKLKLRKTPNAGLGKVGILNAQSKKINQYDLQGNFIRTWYCMTDIQRELNILQSKISLVCNFKRKTSGNYIWRFA